MPNDFLWVEKYRPQKVEDCILPTEVKTTFKSFIEQGEIPNLLLSGTAGVGKTTIAKALCNELGAYSLLELFHELPSLNTPYKRLIPNVSYTSIEDFLIFDAIFTLNIEDCSLDI